MIHMVESGTLGQYINSTQQLAELPACFFCRGPAPHTPRERVLGALSFFALKWQRGVVWCLATSSDVSAPGPELQVVCFVGG